MYCLLYSKYISQYRLGCKLCQRLLCRSPEKVAALKEEIKAAGGGGKISAYTYDLSSFAEINKLAEAIKAEHKNIDVLINNAGIFAKQKALSQGH